MSEKIQIPARPISRALVTIKGISPLIVHKFGAKALKELEDGQKKKAKEPRTKDPEALFNDCLHYFPDGKTTGFPASGIKQAIVRAGQMFGYKMTQIRPAIFINPDPSDTSGELVRIKGTPTLRKDWVRVANGNPDIRIRPEYKEWVIELDIEFNTKFLAIDALLQLIMEASNTGIGDWRGERNGTFGRWTIVSAQLA